MSASTVIFAGPSLTPGDRADFSGFDWHGPAATGDLLWIAIERQPRCICLIDGYFDHRPAPWHKEIMVVLSMGIAVVGASSMGALRAAELQDFGMIGIGQIFRAYANGLLTGDDEVALVHAPERLQWAPLSVPMVEIRATLLSFVRGGKMDASMAHMARSAAHAVHYADRDWPKLTETWIGAGMPAELARSIQHHHVPLKRHDARQCVDHVRSAAIDRPPRLEVPATRFLLDLRAELGI